MRRLIPLLILWPVVLVNPVAGQQKASKGPPSLETGLVQAAPALIEHFTAKVSRNVGVLKFLIAREGSEELSDSTGTLNMLLARRMEVALVLADKAKPPVNIIRNASAVAARTKGASHRNPAGIKKLFEPDYPLAWGKTEVKADAFITGLGLISRDLKTMTISLFVLEKMDGKLKPFGKDFSVRLDAGKLGEINESYTFRGITQVGSESDVIQAAAAVAEQSAKHPLESNTPPVTLEVLYDDKPAKLKFESGKAFLPEPTEEQDVKIRLRRDNGKERYGVVLKVNGESTVGRETLPDSACRRWILDPGVGPLTISGYQMDDEKAIRFRVLSPEESQQRGMNYSDHVGVISLTVYRERSKQDIGDPTEEQSVRNERLTRQAKLPQAKSLDALKSALLEEANETRGLIGEGERILSRVQRVTFDPHPVPVMSAAVIYSRK